MFKQESLFKNNIFVMLFFVTLFAFLFTQLPNLQQAGMYKEKMIQAGQVWRLVTACFVHINIWHLAGNLLAFYLVTNIVSTSLTLTEHSMRLILSCMAVTCCLYFVTPEVTWYCGLSGPLHALWTWNAARLVCNSYHHNDKVYAKKTRLVGMIFLHAILIKLLYELNVGSLTLFSNFTNYPVLTVSHRFGALAGLALSAATMLRRGWR